MFVIIIDCDPCFLTHFGVKLLIMSVLPDYILCKRYFRSLVINVHDVPQSLYHTQLRSLVEVNQAILAWSFNCENWGYHQRDISSFSYMLSRYRGYSDHLDGRIHWVSLSKLFIMDLTNFLGKTVQSLGVLNGYWSFCSLQCEPSMRWWQPKGKLWSSSLFSGDLSPLLLILLMIPTQARSAPPPL